MSNKYLLLSLEDERSKHLAEVLGNKTCKKIIDFLAEKSEASEKDIADGLGMPINTIEYNLKKLQKAEIAEKTKNFFWSKKGKKIPTYKLSNKSIVISPGSRLKTKVKSILPVALIGTFASLLIGLYSKTKQKTIQTDNEIIMQSKASAIPETFARESPNFAQNALKESTNQDYGTLGKLLFTQPDPIWIWFLIGVIFTLILFTAINWRKI